MITRKELDEIAGQRILILDGAMGSMIQGLKLGEEDFRGNRFKDHRQSLAGCNDLLCLTRPELIGGIHEAYLRAGADIIETCSFNSTSVSLGDYGIGGLAYELSAAAAALARKAADKFTVNGRPRLVAGSMGPTAKSAGISPDMDDPGKRSISWDELEAAYYDNARGLLDGGADLLLIETIFDTLNAKAAIAAVLRLREERGADIPLMLSATITEAGRLLTGQTVEAFCISVLHADPWAVGLNCSFGAERLKARIADLADFAPCLVSAYPNAGLPNQAGAYDEDPAFMASCIEAYMKEGLINIVGGCCGSTPEHIAAIAARGKAYPPRKCSPRRKSFLAGLKPLPLGGPGFLPIGERTNVAGSRKFLRLIKEANYDEAVEIARDMVEKGAAVIDICMDDAMLDAGEAMRQFINLAVCFHDIAELPVMVDSSRWELIETGLKCLQGKGLVNSISLKEGEALFLKRARLAQRYGAAVVVMLFDERGQAADYERKIEIAGRSYKLLTGGGFPPEDIVFDPNVLAVATGMAEHDRYALDFIRACVWIREHCPGAQISGGISNLSFSFRGNEEVRQALHSVFLKHAVEAGLTMAIVNPSTLIPYDKLNAALREAAEDVILCRRPDAAQRLLVLAETGGEKTEGAAAPAVPEWRRLPVRDRIIQAMLKGIDDRIEADVLELRNSCEHSLEIVEGPLMEGMREVGNRFGEGKMFLPQVIRAARVMKKAVAALKPFIEQERAAEAGASAGKAASPESTLPRILLATVKGDVHDIGKNIVGLVLGCNGYDILDLGVMTPAETILEAAEQQRPAAVGLSGLISPSLDEMVHTAETMERRGLTIPLLIGGAATSLAHTALRIAPQYSGPVVYVSDASQCPSVIRSLLSETERPRFLEELEQRYRDAVMRHEKIRRYAELLPLPEARKNRPSLPNYQTVEPRNKDIIELQDYPPHRVIPYIDWNSFLQTWDLAEETYPSAYSPTDRENRKEAREKLLREAHALLDRIAEENILKLRGVVGFFPVRREGDDILILNSAKGQELKRFCFPRNQEKKRTGSPNSCLADFVSDKNPDWIGLFALSAGFGLAEAAAEYTAHNDDYSTILLASLANSLTEAFSEEVHLRVRREWWGYESAPENSAETAGKTGKFPGIRPAFGYPACPDHRDKETALDLLGARERCGFTLTDTAMIVPAASVCGMYFSHPSSYYFGVGRLDDDQIQDWAERKGISGEDICRRIGRL